VKVGGTATDINKIFWETTRRNVVGVKHFLRHVKAVKDLALQQLLELSQIWKCD
jgi:hypothetical protein